MNWIDRYVEWASKHSDASPLAHRWCGYAVVAARSRGAMDFDWGPKRLSCQIHLMLLPDGPEQLAAEAMDLAGKIAEGACVWPAGTHLSAEAFHHAIGNDWCIRSLLLLKEYDWPRWTTGQLGQALCALADDLEEYPFEYKRTPKELEKEKRGKREVRVYDDDWDEADAPYDRPRFTVMATLSAKALGKALKRGGYVKRFLPVLAGPGERKRPWPPAPDKQESQELSCALQNVTSDHYKLSLKLDGIKDAYAEWARGFEERSIGPRRQDYLILLKQTCLKLTILDHVATEENGDAVSVESLRRAIEMIEGVAVTLDEMDRREEEEAEKGRKKSPSEKERLKVEKELSRRPMTRLTDLIRKTRLTRERVLAVVDVLEEDGAATVSDVKTGGRPTYEIHWNCQLTTDNCQLSETLSRVEGAIERQGRQLEEVSSGALSQPAEVPEPLAVIGPQQIKPDFGENENRGTEAAVSSSCVAPTGALSQPADTRESVGIIGPEEIKPEKLCEATRP